MNSSVILCIIAVLTVVMSQKTLVVMDIYSGMPNPRWHLEGEERESFLKIAFYMYKDDQYSCMQSSHGLGYKGFRVFDSELTQCLYVQNAQEVELFLLKKYDSLMAENNHDSAHAPLMDHIKDIIANRKNHVEPFLANQSNSNELKNELRGPDNVTAYTPDKWNDERVITQNNCYNYATDVMTWSLAHPGRGSGQMGAPLDCDTAWHHSIADGLQPLDDKLTCPKGQPELGHYTALFVINSRDFHVSCCSLALMYG
ncbi:insoluble matrix shell protein [Acrasis kona]|uniref:Insoluble matrix shell protein n=1 Tax=Acrasis kona TaxID=1008807 RepID=A0AAW2YN75_9EUKA